MQAFYLCGARDLRAEEIDRPQIAADEVLVQIRATGICGSDLHYYLHGRNGDFVPDFPDAALQPQTIKVVVDY